MRKSVVFTLMLLGILIGGLVWWRVSDDDSRARIQPNRAERRTNAVEVENPKTRADKNAPTTSENTQPRATTTQLPPVDIGELRTLRGKLVWNDGAPVFPGKVWLGSSPYDYMTSLVLGENGTVVSVAHCDEEGRFRVEWATGSRFRLFASTPAGPSTVLTERPVGDEITIVLDRSPARLAIEVVRMKSGAPVAGARIEVRWGETLATVSGVTDSGGWFRSESVPAGGAQIDVTPANGEHIVGRRIQCSAGELTRTRIELGLGLTVKGTVVADESGAPVVGATAMLGYRYFNPRPSTRSNSQGKFVLPALPWDRRTIRTFTVVADGFASWVCPIGHKKNDGDVEELEVRLLRPATVRLRCVNADGSARSGVQVIARSARLPSGSRSVRADSATGVSNEAGDVELTGLPPGQWGSVTCWIQGMIAIKRPLKALQASEIRDLGEFVIHVPVDLSGAVRTAKGKPATGSIVVVVPHDDEDPEFHGLADAIISPRQWASVGPTGGFRIRGLRAGSWDLLVHGGGNARLLRAGIPVAAGKNVAGLTLRLPPAISLRGRVVDRDGRGIAGERIEFLRAYPVPSNLAEPVKTDAKGNFSIPGFTEQDEDVVLYFRNYSLEVTPRDGPTEIVLDRRAR